MQGLICRNLTRNNVMEDLEHYSGFTLENWRKIGTCISCSLVLGNVRVGTSRCTTSANEDMRKYKKAYGNAVSSIDWSVPSLLLINSQDCPTLHYKYFQNTQTLYTQPTKQSNP